MTWKTFLRLLPGFGIAAILAAQTGQYQDPYQNPQSPGTSSPISSSCADPQNANLPECRANVINSVRPPSWPQSGDQSAFPGTGQQPARVPYPQDRTLEDRPKDPLTEFQRFILASTGQLLPIYGSWLFEHVPSTFAPLDQVPVNPEYKLGPGDRIDVRVWGQINFSQPLTIDRSGDVFLPQVGRISLAGLPFAQVQSVLLSAIGRVYKNFDVSVSMGRLRSIEIFVVGQARRPGNYTVSSLSTLVNALFASGGPSSRGSMRRIQLKRCDQVVTTFDLYDLLMRGDKSKDAPLQAGDVIFIPRAGPRVAVSGTVETPAIYEINDNSQLGDVLNDAGGLSSVAAGKRVILERISQHAALLSEDVALTPQGLSKVLQDGDMIRMLAIVPRFENTITLKGNVADPVRLPWHAGMRVSDAIPDKEVLLTRSYWTERNKLSDDKQEKAQLADLRAQALGGRATSLQPLGYPALGQPMASQALDGQPMDDATLLASLNPAELNAGTIAPAYHDEVRNSKADKSLAASLSSNEAPPVRYFSFKNDVQPPAPDIDWSFASIERIDNQTLTTRLIPFNLGRVVIDHDAAADVLLQPGDVITIFSRADIATPHSEQAKQVRLEGEVKMAGVYSVGPNETLRQLVARAGGLSPDAYLYGAQFTRESTRREQQKRYNDFLDQLDRDISQSGSSLAGRITSADQGSLAQASLTNQRSMVEKLREIPVSGRIVFELEPGSRGVDALPDIPLENGDRLFIPNVPSTLNVVGTVYNQSSFLMTPDFRLVDYLKEAGGPTPYADKSHTFVIRANGAIIAREGRSGLFTGNFEMLRMYPGDTIVVPTNVNRTTKLRGLLDWSQVFSGFGLAAAAVSVLK
jgi:protein involved in polysaccharide export with SLBB domain